MSGRIEKLACWLLPLWLAVAVPVLAWAAPPPAMATGADTAAFDELYRQLDDTELVLDSAQDVERVLARLHALLPPGDAARARRYQLMRCFYAYPEDVRQGIRAADQGIAEATAAQDGYVASGFHMCRGTYVAQEQSSRAALPDYDAAVRLARRQEHARLLADALSWRANAYSDAGEQAKGLRDLQESYRLFEQGGYQRPARIMLVSMATIYRRLGEYDKAGEYLQRSLQIAKQEGGRAEIWSIEMERVFLALERGDSAAAAEPLAHAETLVEGMRSKSAQRSVLIVQAQMDNAEGRHADALRKLEAASGDLERVGGRSLGNMVTLQQAIAHAGLDQRAQAEREFADAERRLKDSADIRYLAVLYAERAKNHEAMGEDAAALADLKAQMAVEARLASMAKTQVTALMSYQFDAERRELENRKLQADRKLQGERLAALERVRAWQRTAITLTGMLILLMAWLAIRQWREGRRLSRLTQLDPLTGISNRRHAETLLEAAVADARALGRPLAVAMLDIDHFKQVNDTYGHPVGDRVLQAVTLACLDALRQNDSLGRLGGEEFVALLPGTDAEGALLVAERLRRQVAEAATVLDEGGAELRVTVSLGIAMLEPGEASAGDLLQRADAALYRAKEAGRNRVEMAPR